MVARPTAGHSIFTSATSSRILRPDGALRAHDIRQLLYSIQRLGTILPWNFCGHISCVPSLREPPTPIGRHRPERLLRGYSNALPMPLQIIRIRSAASYYVSGNLSHPPSLLAGQRTEEADMDGIIYLVGLIVIVMFILSLFGLR
jgi:hypothetical protein